MKKILTVTFLIIVTAVGAMSAQASASGYYDGRPRCADNPGGTCS